MYIRVIEQDDCVFNFLHLSFKKTTIRKVPRITAANQFLTFQQGIKYSPPSYDWYGEL